MEIVTSYYSAYRPEMGVPVRITLGAPPSWFKHPWEEARMLAPPPRVFRLKDDEEFRRKYRHHLYRVTPERIGQRLEEIASRHPGERLVLLCFEANPAECHRSMFAEWWMEQTGQRVVELPGKAKPPNPDQEPLF